MYRPTGVAAETSARSCRPATCGATSGFLGTLRLEPLEVVTEHWHPYSEEFLFCVQGVVTLRLDGEERLLSANEGILIPIGVRHRLVNEGATTAFLVFQLAPLAPAPHLGPRRHRGSARGHPRGHAMTGGARRTVVTGVGVVAPGGTNREAFWKLLTAGQTATRRITFLRPGGFPVADRRRVRLRSGGGRALPRRRSTATTASSSSRSPRRMRRSPRAGWTSSPGRGSTTTRSR